MKNILDLNLSALKGWMKANNEREFRARQVFDWIYQGTWSFEAMTNIPKTTQRKLTEHFYIEIPEVVQMYDSQLEATHKLLLKYRDGNVIETVVMEYGYGNSICLSTQIGCRMGCKFCASTVGGLVRNLSCGEIIGQILRAQKEIGDRISHVVLMGSGEPLDNYDHVVEFISIINSDYSLNIGQRRITLSTCGIAPKIRALAEMNLQITLAVSLHAPDDHLRRTMMPIANKYSIAEIIDACRYYIDTTNRRVTFEYAIIDGVNDSREHANKLGNLLKGLLCHVNLIAINEVRENNFKRSSISNLRMFQNILMAAGIETTIRKEMGADINAACGQLRRSYITNAHILAAGKATNDVRVDLHIHTTASDGTWNPGQLLSKLLEAGVSLFAVTDHDSVDNLAETAMMAREHGLGFIPGVEINTTYRHKNYHLLGLGIDPAAPELQALLATNRELTEKIDADSIEYLESIIPDVCYEEYRGYANRPERGGWKALNYLIDKGLCSNHRDFLPLFKEWGSPFERLVFASPGAAIRTIVMAGGVPVLAHPGANFYDRDYQAIISYMVDQGIRGIECYHSENGPEITRYCLAVCQSKNLLVTGGSDCHGDFVPARRLGHPEIRGSQLNLDEIQKIMI